MISRKSSSGNSRNGWVAPPPALFTNTSMPPSSPASASTVSAAVSKSVTSSWVTTALCPCASTSRPVSSAPSRSLCQVMPTSKPSRASRTAVALPIPESDPVMIAVLAIWSGYPEIDGTLHAASRRRLVLVLFLPRGRPHRGRERLGDMDGEAAQEQPGTEEERRSLMMVDISNAMVHLYKELFGRGPTKARTSYAGPDLLVSTLENSLTRIERTMAEAGEHERLRDLRMHFQYLGEDDFVGIVEQITGRKVRAFVSGMDTKNDVASELFYLEPEPAAS